MNVLQNFLPSNASILYLKEQKEHPAVLVSDIDGDQINELIGAYKFEGQTYLLILKLVNDQWLPLIHIQGKGYGISDLIAAPLTDNWVNTLIVGWQIGSIWAQLELLQWTNSGFVQLPTNDLVYSKLEVEDMPGPFGQDGQFELAVWEHDTGEAYKVEVYRFSDGVLVQAKDVYPYYFKKVAAYYQNLLEANDFSYYWYYLADAQEKAGDLEQSLYSLEKALSFRSPYPSKEVLLNKRQQVLDRLREANYNGQIVITQKRGDVTGDGLVDTIFLTGEMTQESPFWKNITLVIHYGNNDLYERISLKENAGYNPTIFLGDMTGDKVDDIQIVIDTGGSGGTIYSYVFSYLEGELHQIFDTETYNEISAYQVKYLDNYKASVQSSYPKKRYIIDLIYKGKEYLSEIYQEDGALKTPIEGWVDPMSGLYPIDFARDGTYELLSFQRISGRYHADVIGEVQTTWKWNGQEFIADRQSVSIFGEDT